MFKINLKKNKGFTIIETLVSLALFSIVVVMFGGVVVSVIGINKRNQIISGVVNNLNYSVDSMVRDIKTGYAYRCDASVFTVDALMANKEESSCANSTIIFLVSTISGKDTVVKYELIQPEDSNFYINKTIYDEEGNDSSEYSITDKTNVDIEILRFDVFEYDPLECVGPSCIYGQPSVFVLIKGSAGDIQDVESSKFYIQNFISQRKLNLN